MDIHTVTCGGLLIKRKQIIDIKDDAGGPKREQFNGSNML